MLSTYPTTAAVHGGQKRVAAIAHAYRSAGFEVMQTGVFSVSQYRYASDTDIPLSSTFERQVARSPFTADFLSGRAVTEDRPVRNELASLLRWFRPHLVQFEQPYLYHGVRELLIRAQLSPLLVYSSHNIEGPMKRHILRQFGWPGKQVERFCRRVDRMELMLSRESDLVAACSESDLQVHRAFGARRTVLAPNGVEAQPSQPGALNPDPADTLPGKRIVLFVGSGHLPNFTGFRELVGPDLAFLPADAELVIVGDICRSVEQFLDSAGVAPDARRPVLAGQVPEGELRRWIERAEVILLPITSGGGSNLKTAEAIAAQRKVVATEFALRSHPWFVEFPNVWTANRRVEFHRSINQALTASYVDRTPSQKQATATVYWDSCLQPLLGAVSDLVGQPNRGEGDV